ncbi:MAG: glycoside hydrolase family 16 protein, partial [Ilumatobacter sp.]
TDVLLGAFPDAVSSSWSAYLYPWSDTSKNGTYAPKKVVSVHDGVLDKYIHTEGSEHLVAAVLPKVPGSSKYGTLYGRYEVRFRSERLPGYKIAWLLWPDSGTNTTGAVGGGGNGEIDFPEMNLDATEVAGFVHHQNATVNNDQSMSKASVDISTWHTYTFEWSPNLVVFYLDGVEIGRHTERIPNTAMHWVLQTETSLGGSTPRDDVRGHVEIDYVSFWKYAP